MQTIPQFPFHNSMMQMAFASYNPQLGIHPAMINTPYEQSPLYYKPLTAGFSDREKGKSFTIEALLRPDSPRDDHVTSRLPHPYYSQLRQFGKTGKFKKCVIDEEQWKGGKCKRVRTIFTPDQLERLEAEFERQQYMVGTERFYLASSLNLSEAQVKVWFQNRRIKWRKQNLEMQQARIREVDLYSQGESESGSESDDSER